MQTWTAKAARMAGLKEKDIIALSVGFRRFFPHTGFREHQRVPLWHPRVPFVLLTSQKAGSTLGVAWFLHHAGLLDEARRYHPFAHRYEQDVLLRTPEYFEGLQEAVATRPVLKLVREPGTRAFSSYLALHTTAVVAEENDHRQTLRRRIAQHAQLVDEPDGKISFGAFLSWVAAENHRRLDGHEARQVNQYEDRLPLGLPEPVKLEDAANALPAIEDRFGLVRSSASQLEEFGASPHYVPKRGNSSMVEMIVKEGLELPRPKDIPSITTQMLADYPRAHEHLLTAYGEDFRRYGYPTYRR